MDLWIEKSDENTIQIEPNTATEPHFVLIRSLVFVRFFTNRDNLNVQ